MKHHGRLDVAQVPYDQQNRILTTKASTTYVTTHAQKKNKPKPHQSTYMQQWTTVNHDMKHDMLAKHTALSVCLPLCVHVCLSVFLFCVCVLCLCLPECTLFISFLYMCMPACMPALACIYSWLWEYRLISASTAHLKQNDQQMAFRNVGMWTALNAKPLSACIKWLNSIKFRFWNSKHNNVFDYIFNYEPRSI